MTGLLMASLALATAQSWMPFNYIGVHGGELVVASHTAIVVQCAEEEERITVTIHVPHGDAPRRTEAELRTLRVEMDGSGDVRTVERMDERPLPGVFQFEPDEWLVDFLLAGGRLDAEFEGVRLEIPVEGSFMRAVLDHCTGGTHIH